MWNAVVITNMFVAFCTGAMNPVADEPMQVGSDCSFEHAGGAFPVHASAPYRLDNGLMAQSISQYHGCGSFERTLVVDCDANRSILVPVRSNWTEEWNDDLEGPPLRPFLVERGATNVDALAEVFGDRWTRFDTYLSQLEDGNGPNAYCGCGKTGLSSEKED
ncbi:hypothetical protein [Thalassococcus lentus]|uniref:Uncharacterized protein n=1 Tax=Thalassococcus lentus TaxID=1210524 RepID=A0ABT4XXF7_9RHOB|nr:hypothetical protein [Thalassococcus lentus]MDA7426618.1 hypothetical protein [Thalassococcus lentus]